MSSSAAALMLQQFTANSSFQPTNSATTISEEGDDDEAVNGMVHEDDDEEEDDDLDDEEGEEEEGLLMDDNGMAYGDDEDDEDDEEIKNGFRALGLMGNVAFMGEEKFKCPVCGIKLDSQHTFTLHIRSHNPNDHSNTCRLCGKTLSSASSLDRHMLIHSGERVRFLGVFGFIYRRSARGDPSGLLFSRVEIGFFCFSPVEVCL